MAARGTRISGLLSVPRGSMRIKQTPRLGMPKALGICGVCSFCSLFFISFTEALMEAAGDNNPWRLTELLLTLETLLEQPPYGCGCPVWGQHHQRES